MGSVRKTRIGNLLTGWYEPVKAGFMLYGQYAPWENYPKKLRHSEVVNPLVVITDFFSADLPGGHHKKLKKWRHYVLKDKVYKDKRHGPGSLLFYL